MPIMPRLSEVRGRKSAEAEQRHGDGNGGALGKGLDLLLGAGNDDAVSGQNQRALRFR